MSNFLDLEIMSRTIYGEARGESREGKIAVGWVILNRFKAKRWYSADTIAGTCMKKLQFSCWNKNDPMRPRLLAADVEKLANCIEAAVAVLAGKEPDPTGGATFYLNPAVLPTLPKWALKKPPIKIIGAHHFFDDPDR
jgi:spore germination cell wall hydrolase CwlJ-like protein